MHSYTRQIHRYVASQKYKIYILLVIIYLNNGQKRFALTLEQNNIIVTLMSDTPLMSQIDVARVFSLKYGQTVTKGILYRIREKLNKPEKIKSREIPVRFSCSEEYVMDELREVPTTNASKRFRVFQGVSGCAVYFLQHHILLWEALKSIYHYYF